MGWKGGGGLGSPRLDLLVAVMKITIPNTSVYPCRNVYLFYFYFCVGSFCVTDPRMKLTGHTSA